MTHEERQKIYHLLSEFYPKAKRLQKPETRTAWGLILEQFTYEDVKNAVLTYAAKNKFHPDISDITGGLVPVAGAPEPEPQEKSSSWYLTAATIARIEQQDARRKAQEAAEGGPCQIRQLWDADFAAGESMMEGLFLRRHYPQDCAGCRRMAVSGICKYRFMTEKIDREREHCLILKAHSGEAHQGELLNRYWRELCSMCSAKSCFWPAGMQLAEVESKK